MKTSAFQVAERFCNRVKEIPGEKNHPLVVYMLQLAAGSGWPNCDEIPWCSAFVYFIAFTLDMVRPSEKCLRARSWLRVGHGISVDRAEVGNDIVILKRGTGRQPGPEVLDAKGHVGFFAGRDDCHVLVLGGNQDNAVNISRYPAARILGIRRLYLNHKEVTCNASL
jgi:uncharacterized protein (TIGR02594 family)